jgi:hypothetical protein
MKRASDGTFEADWAAEGGSILERTRQLRDILLGKGMRFTIDNSTVGTTV